MSAPSAGAEIQTTVAINSTFEAVHTRAAAAAFCCAFRSCDASRFVAAAREKSLAP